MFNRMCIYVSFYSQKTPLFDCRLVLPVGIENILTNQTKSNYPTHTNATETIWRWSTVLYFLMIFFYEVRLMYMCLFTCVYLHVFIYMCLFTCVYLHVFIYMCLFTCVYLHVFIYMCLFTRAKSGREMKDCILSLLLRTVTDKLLCSISSCWPIECIFLVELNDI